jgi:hypothetical protein
LEHEDRRRWVREVADIHSRAQSAAQEVRAWQ